MAEVFKTSVLRNMSFRNFSANINGPYEQMKYCRIPKDYYTNKSCYSVG